MQTTRCLFPLAALLAIIGAQQQPSTASSSSAAPLDDLAVAEQDYVNPLSRNLAFGALFDQIAADGANLQRSTGGFFSSPFYRSYARFLYSLFGGGRRHLGPFDYVGSAASSSSPFLQSFGARSSSDGQIANPAV